MDYFIFGIVRCVPACKLESCSAKRKEDVEFSSRDSLISKVPSVKYRGFFINDEWPAFGTWAKTHFGGMNTKCYEKIFELLLRLKGNYLWPAMWESNFNLDGPGLENARVCG